MCAKADGRHVNEKNPSEATLDNWFDNIMVELKAIKEALKISNRHRSERLSSCHPPSNKFTKN